jgi:hypothetical protein
MGLVYTFLSSSCFFEADGDVMWCVGPRSVAEDVMVVCLATMSDAEKRVAKNKRTCSLSRLKSSLLIGDYLICTTYIVIGKLLGSFQSVWS